MFANTLFQCIDIHPEEFHLLTGGSDRKIAYWETYDGAQIRELEASKSGTINGLDIDAEGKLFVTGSSDKLVKVILVFLFYVETFVLMQDFIGMEIQRRRSTCDWFRSWWRD